jgi:hypothetical protein
MYQTSQIDMAKKTTKLQTHIATLLTLLPHVVQKEHTDNISNVQNWFGAPFNPAP